MFVRNKVFRNGVFYNNARSYFLSRTSNFIDDEEFFVLSHLFLTFSSGKNACLPYEDYTALTLNEMTESECLSEIRFEKRDILMW